MRFGSVCSGIGAPEAAWTPLGWECAFVSEIEPFPCAILEHHYPGVPNLGDMTKITEADLERCGPIDVLVGGTPCQSFSVAGLRGGMADPRGGLALVFLDLARRTRARWVVWENVPGVLSADGGAAFGSFLGGLADLGYGFCWRVLDAQYAGLAQRRKRVFVVAHSGGCWQRPAAVLLERASLRGDPAPSRAEGEGVAGCLDGGAHGGGFDDNDARAGKCVAVEEDNQNGTRLSATAGAIRADAPGTKPGGTLALVPALTSRCGDTQDDQQTGQLIPTLAPTLRAGGNRTGGHRPPGTDVDTCETLIPFDLAQVTSDKNYSTPKPGDPRHPLASFSAKDAHVAIGFHSRQDPISSPVSMPLEAKAGQAVQAAFGVRRLVPREAERLQGFPDNWTAIPYRGKPAADGPRYRALGNSMAVPVVAWIGKRIAMVDALT